VFGTGGVGAGVIGGGVAEARVIGGGVGWSDWRWSGLE
jgi:hypothetical protein